MKFLKKLLVFWQAIFDVPTLQEIIEHEAEKARREKIQSENVIKNHSFQLHMAEARLNAIQTWEMLSGREV